MFVVVKHNLEKDGDKDDHCFDSYKQPDLQDPLFEEEGMDDALQQGPSSKEDSHEHVGRFESVHVGQKVTGEFTILVVVAQVRTDADQHHHQHEQHGEDFHDGRDKSVAEEGLKGSAPQESEDFEIALDEDFD